MNLALKIGASAALVVAATWLARRFPSLAGLIGVMPLTGALVLAFVYAESRGDPAVGEAYARGALWGLIPVAAFYLAAWLAVKRELPLAAVLAAGFGAWGVAAAVHRYFVR